ncbi:Verru_Chthon cassette protein A [Phragmitibacter flavus]|uniref:Verru_Chthon cassette protein A n=1 Tax=Phragmitibacter flavus TaxID=2576071 RepID=A0A5R8KDS0_9BACT|nr:Verru_Chthon cassette protein A [Phragmitibacter flavus]TLD70450.1 Verru_Chthon cassette protein A [Phragmitibacter flavus]
MKNPLRASSLLTVCSIFCFQMLEAADFVWDSGGGEDTNFSTAANWEGDAKPTSADNALINGTVTISSDETVAGFEAGRWFGSATVAHSAGTLTTGWFNVGLYGTGTYNLTGSGSISATGDASIGHGSGNGTMNINTTGSASFNYVNVGHSSWGNADYPTGVLTVDAGTVNSNFGFAIGGSGGTGTLNLNGGAIISGGTFSVGQSPYSSENATAIGVMNQSGGSLSADLFIVGNATGANGTYHMTGGTLNASGELWVGQNGTGVFNQSSGTVSSNNWFVIGRDNGGNGTYNLTGGTVNAATTGGQTVLSSFAGGTSTLNVSGGTFNATNELWVGEGGDGTLTLSAEGVVTTGVTGYTRIAQGGGVGEVNLDGGTLTTGGVAKGGGSSGILNFNGGTLQASQSTGSYLQGLTRVNVRDDGAVFDTNGFNITVNQVLEHSNLDGDDVVDGGLTKRGLGILTLTAANTYTGTTTIEQGVLLANNALGTSATGAGHVLVQSGGRLAGSGQVGLSSSQQNITLGNGSFLSVGTSSGLGGQSLRLVNSGTGVTSLGGTLELNIWNNVGAEDNLLNPLDNNDLLVIASDSTVQLSGSLSLTDTTGLSNDDFIGWALGDTWRLIDWSGVTAATVYSGDLVFDDMPELAEGLKWESLLNEHGYHVRVAVVPEPGRVLLLLTGGLCLVLRRRRSVPPTSCREGMKPYGLNRQGVAANRSRSQSGMVLVLVLVIMSILMVLVLAMFSLGTVETKSSAAFSETAEARTLSDMPASIVMGQIQQATADLGMARTWASQPGMIRVFGTSPHPGGGSTAQLRSATESVWKLYSSDKMVESGADFVAADEAASLGGWDTAPARFTDLNEPVARLNANGTIDRIYPILSPTALPGTGNTGVGGFGISTTQAVPGGTDQQPLPMPTRWLYVLQDGKLVAPTGGTAEKVTFDPDAVTQNNPIVGRIAFWTDDESCKVNINTAGEGTPWDVPRTTSWTDRNYAYFPPAQNEFQRYPGHPGMTSLSVVLQGFDPRYRWRYPNIINDGTVSNKPEYQTWLGGVYNLLPRIHLGESGQGSRGGSELVSSPNGLPFKRERLFATTDEFFFGTEYDPVSGQRQPNLSAGSVDARDLETGRFFLTAHSRAPETNGFNRPRISLWPIQAETEARNSKDKLLEFCANVAGEQGYFQRAETWKSLNNRGSSQSPVADFELAGNQKVFSYLQRLTQQPVPGFGAQTFRNKYGERNQNQILLNMFDMVRWGVNPASRHTDPEYRFLPPTRVSTDANGAEFFAEGSAAPVVTNGAGVEPFGETLKSFGHFPSVIEAALVFIATDVELLPDGTPKDEDGDNIADKTNKMRAFLILQPFAPVVGLPGYSPDVNYRIRGLETWRVNGASLGFPADAVNHARMPCYDTWDEGRSSAYTSLHAQFFRSRATAKLVDGGSNPVEKFPFVSVEVDVSVGDTFTFTGGPITIETHIGSPDPGAISDATLIQTANLTFPDSTTPWPTPRARQRPKISWDDVDWTWENAKNKMSVQSRLVNDNPAENLFVPGDVVRSVAAHAGGPNKGDYRLLCALREIPATYYAPHADYLTGVTPGTAPAGIPGTTWMAQTLRRSANSYQGHYGRGMEQQSVLYPTKGGRLHPWQAAGYVLNGSNLNQIQPYGLLKEVAYWQDCQPATPYRLDGAYNTGAGSASRPGDWDSGIGRVEDGPYINQPDTTGFKTNTTTDRTSYFSLFDYTDTEDAGNYAPNRQIASAVAFGSLPSGVHPVPGIGNKVGPWQTLLFSPNPPSRSTASGAEPTQVDHYGFRPPRDHLLLDLFWMPVVEPYAISEPLSTSGKINMNQQIMPFTYLRRETGLHAALRGTRLSAVPTEVAWAGDASTWGAGAEQKQECYKAWDNWLKYETMFEINAEETMRGFHRRFNAGDIFRSASEICEIFLVPKKIEGRTYPQRVMNTPDPTFENVVTWWNGSLNTQKDGMELTGDNVRESPYNQLYPRLTTRSNTFQVHYRVQALKKARSSAAAEWDENADALIAEQRGSALIERYVDPNDPTLPALIENTNATEAIDDHYRFRIINKKTFAP